MNVKNISHWAGNISLIHSIPKSYDMASYQLISCCSTESQDFNINMSISYQTVTILQSY